jgi:hypothetical protein
MTCIPSSDQAFLDLQEIQGMSVRMKVRQPGIFIFFAIKDEIEDGLTFCREKSA